MNHPCSTARRRASANFQTGADPSASRPSLTHFDLFEPAAGAVAVALTLGRCKCSCGRQTADDHFLVTGQLLPTFDMPRSAFWTIEYL